MDVKADLGIIGGTGIYGVQGMEVKEQLSIETPFGPTSSKIIIGVVEGMTVAFLARHDVGHRLLPTEIPFRANIWALKSVGVKYILSFGACGSLKEEARPLDVVLVDQFIDRTNSRPQTFFGDGIIAHVALGDPVCQVFKGIVKDSLQGIVNGESKIHDGGTYICIEGPAFSTKAESLMYRQWGGTVIGMTAVPEVKLVREAEIAYVCVALVTDFDCWHPDHDHVTVELVMNNLKKNGDMAQKIVKEIVKEIQKRGGGFVSSAHSALQFSILTPKDKISDHSKQKLKPIIGKYI
jgi:5'-methylthioadenosine phosphorylase